MLIANSTAIPGKWTGTNAKTDVYIEEVKICGALLKKWSKVDLRQCLNFKNAHSSSRTWLQSDRRRKRNINIGSNRKGKSTLLLYWASSASKYGLPERTASYHLAVRYAMRQGHARFRFSVVNPASPARTIWHSLGCYRYNPVNYLIGLKKHDKTNVTRADAQSWISQQ